MTCLQGVSHNLCVTTDSELFFGKYIAIRLVVDLI